MVKLCVLFGVAILLSLSFGFINGAPQVPCYFIFGDSLVDNGNNNRLSSLAKANYMPYGIDFPNGPTGRFSNGKTTVDVIAELLGFENYIPPYSAARVSQVVNLLGSEANAANYLSKCIYSIGLGSNDYLNNYFMPLFYSTSRRYNPEQYANVLIQQYTQQLQALYNYGARKFVLIGLGQIGCSPNELAQNSRDGRTCVERINAANRIFNNKLKGLVDQFNNANSDAKFIYIDVYGIFQDVTSNPSAYGFRVTNAGCCGVGRNNGQITCLPLQRPCRNRNEYLFWDAFHPTEAANVIIGRRSYNAQSPSDAYPIDIRLSIINVVVLGHASLQNYCSEGRCCQYWVSNLELIRYRLLNMHYIVANARMESQNTNEIEQISDDIPSHNSVTVGESDPSTSALSSTLRHRLFSRQGTTSKEPAVDSLVKKTHSETYKFCRAPKPSDAASSSSSKVIESTHLESTITAARAHNSPELTDPIRITWNLLFFTSRLVINPIYFLLKLIIRSITFPISTLSYCIILIIDPFRPLKQIKAYLISKLIKLWFDSPCGRLIFKTWRGILWVAYLGFVLCGLLFTSLVISWILMGYLVEKPLEIKETLNFDYTKGSPVAYVPIISCAAVGCGVTVSLTLPESDYNRNLGILPIRLLLTLFKAVPLVTGIISEVQTLNVKLKDLNQGTEPTACLKVVLEQRPAHGSGSGIPDLYGASLVLESKLPFIKRIIWYWRKTLFIWVSIMSFVLELLFMSVCFGCVLVPGKRKTTGSTGN
ncbi:hypothetical protein CXB51_015517 [Gossypium anomalum]|uniref:Uncharacterized protein n=1 Tax=Gossypium anomalum TaxID=47600 RepID=A0A8J6CWK3_9ROSI|nr:hypothetical protein CXB51_015517 [Gossypium anomalum]